MPRKIPRIIRSRIAIWAQEYFTKAMGKKFQIIRPRMPLQEYAKYTDWKLYFERFLPVIAVISKLQLTGKNSGILGILFPQ